jgi:histidine phosphotransfer protein HptB
MKAIARRQTIDGGDAILALSARSHGRSRFSLVDEARGCPPQHTVARLGAVCRLLHRSGTQFESIIHVSAETERVPAIDMRSIARLAEDDESGSQFIADIIDVFLVDLRERVSKIGAQVSQGDRAGVASTAHAIKGSCSHFGAARLVDLSRELEDRARHEPDSDLQAAVDSMLAETERVRDALETYRCELALR